MHFKSVKQDMKLSVFSDTLSINSSFRRPEEKQKIIAKDGGRRVYDVREHRSFPAHIVSIDLSQSNLTFL